MLASKSIEIKDSTLFTIHEWFQEAMGRVGRKVKLPRCKDPIKTYYFRALRSYANKCYNDFGLDDRTIRILTMDIVEYAKSHNLLNKGAQMLCMNSVVDICYHSINNSIENESFLIKELYHCHRFVMRQAGNKDSLVRLMQESASGGYSRIVQWYHCGYITPLYLALSKRCMKALSRIPRDERQELPKDIDLLLMCTHVVSNDLIPKLKEVLGSDLRIPPTAKERK